MNNKSRKILKILAGVIWLVIGVLSIADGRTFDGILDFTVSILFFLNFWVKEK